MLNNSRSHWFSLTLVWTITLIASILPEVLLRELFKLPAPNWLFWFKIVLFLLIFFLGSFFNSIRPARRVSLIFTVLLLLEYATSLIQNTFWWNRVFDGVGFIPTMASQQILRLVEALIMAGVLLILFKKFSPFYLVKGNMNAQATPIPLIMDKATSWNKLGWILVLCISGGTLVFLLIGAGSAVSHLNKVLPFVPFVLLFALMNSFSEELSYRTGFLAALVPEFGKDDALLLTATFFGIEHFYGVPYGIAGVIMAGILGWILGKSMVETKGFTWAWIIHFFQDVLIFTFFAAGSIVAGG